MQGIWEEVQAAAAAIRGQWSGVPRAGLILGTGLGGLAEQIDQQATIPYGEIPGFPISTAPGHAGRLVCGTLRGVPIVAMEGRFHYYEGYSLAQVTFPVRVMKALGANLLIATNAAGGMNPQLDLGGLVVIEDHISLLPDNPLRGVNDDRLGPRWPDLCAPYTRSMIDLTRKAALSLGIQVQKGVFVAVPGPNLETRAEYRMLKAMGADVVGMSTVPEVLVAVHGGMDVLAFSVVTDLCLPDHLEPVEVPKILANAAIGGAQLARLIPEVLHQWSVNSDGLADA
ncbi:MAG TPA: purine-nucleoside phosphorylase [Planctomycetaceae bacterium]|nr:purine-nucleoside phosphorylase [Planctomycetaceae bacterium]